MASVRAVFRNCGFDRCNEIAEKQIEFEGQTGEFDDAFLRENLLTLVEYTTSQTSGVPDHLKKKKIIFSMVRANPKGFISYLRKKFAQFDVRLGQLFHEDDYILRIVYCSYHPYDQNIRAVVNEPIYLDLPHLRYFEMLTGTIHMSASNELFSFLDVSPHQVARNGVLTASNKTATHTGSILPEKASGFPKGYKVVSFYVDAATLLERAYVLRRDGWRSTIHAYQRMLSRKKVEAIRKRLRNERRVFVNNIIATLPQNVRPEDSDGKTIDIASLTMVAPVSIKLPDSANSIGLVDGQHRLYSYYETKGDDAEIKKLRHHQNLLVTGIIYPEGTSDPERERFEAELFLAINSNQTNAPTALRQEIEVLLKPNSTTAIARRVLERLAASGPLAGHVERHFYEKGKLKTSSIVSFALGPLVKLTGEDTIFKLFVHDQKADIDEGTADEALQAYVEFASTTINTFLGAIKKNIESSRWTPDSSIPGRILAVTYVNSFLILLRKLVEEGLPLDFETISTKVENINDFKFKDYHSSQYARMAKDLFDMYFSTSGTIQVSDDSNAN